MAAMVMGLAILAAFALGLVIGRIWQIRSDELQRRASFTLPTIARIPRPSGWDEHAPSADLTSLTAAAQAVG